MGFAYKLAYESYGTYASKWKTASNLNSLKAGDIIRYHGVRPKGHSIFVYEVNGNNIKFADCNWDNNNGVRWAQTTKQAILNDRFQYIDVAPYPLVVKKPAAPKPIVNKTAFKTGETVKISWPAVSGATYYWVDVWTDVSGHTVSKRLGTATSYSFTAKNGAYTVYISACNLIGSSVSKPVNFNVGKYTIKYNANGGAGAPASQTKTHGVSLRISNTEPTRSGYIFTGWATSKDKPISIYKKDSNNMFNGNANYTLYAIWRKANKYTIKYDANGGTGAPASQVKTEGISLRISNTEPTRSGYTFTGWATNKDKPVWIYKKDGNYMFNGDGNYTLYAIWKKSK